MLDQLAHPVVQAPMAGGIATPALAAAVSEAGGLGFLAAGMRDVTQLREDVDAVRAATAAPFGVNLFCPPTTSVGEAALRSYAALLRTVLGDRGGVLAEPRRHDDGYADKLALVEALAPAVVSFTFGCPTSEDIARLRARGSAVWVTVTQVDEATRAAAAGVDAVIAQGDEAGGHRGAWSDDDDRPALGTIELVTAVRHELDRVHAEGPGAGDVDGGLPVIAAGGLMTGEHIAQALGAGAAAAQLGSAFMLAHEAGTGRLHRRLLAEDRPTVVTRAFTGRRARGLANAWSDEVGDRAPSAYPEILTMTAPVRRQGLAVGDADAMALWAGERHALARERPAAELVRELAEELAGIGGF